MYKCLRVSLFVFTSLMLAGMVNAVPVFATGGATVQSSVSTYCGGQYTAQIKFASITAAAPGDSTLVAAVTGKKIRVLSYTLATDTNGTTASFESGTGGTALTGDMNLNVNGIFYGDCVPYGCFETAAATLLNLEVTTGTVEGHLTYVECE